MNTWKWGASFMLAIFVAVVSVPAQAQQQGLAQRVEALEALVVTLQAQITALQGADQTLQNNLTNEIAVRGAADSDLQAQITAIDTGGIPGLANYLTVDTATHTVLFTGANVQIVNGMGSTATINGRGNLIVGYNTDRVYLSPICSNGKYDSEETCVAAGGVFAVSHKSGSHNIVGGDRNSYSSYGGLILGYQGVINGEFSTVGGGGGNIASGLQSSVSGGNMAIAIGVNSSVSGGFGNIASGTVASVSGGFGNTASGDTSSVSGGYGNIAGGARSSVSGGAVNRASGKDSSVSGGVENTTGGEFSSVSGGTDCTDDRAFGWSVGDPVPHTTGSTGCHVSN